MGRVYEEHVLATGGLDERIFLGEGANEDIGTPGPCLCVGVKNQDASAYRLYSSLTVRRAHTHTLLYYYVMYDMCCCYYDYCNTQTHMHVLCLSLNSMQMYSNPFVCPVGLGLEGVYSPDGS